MTEQRTTSHSGGQKGIKPEVFSSMPVDAVFELARVYNHGVQKYEAHNYRKGYEWSKSFDAMMRHAFLFWGGEDIDQESGLHHMAHASWHAMNLVQSSLDHPEFDDRYKKETMQ